MNWNKLHDKLIAAARKNQPGSQVPYAFEKRIMNRLGAGNPHNFWGLWAGPMWRAALSCVAIMILCGVWSIAFQRPASAQDSFSQAFEAAVCAPPSQTAEASW